MGGNSLWPVWITSKNLDVWKYQIELCNRGPQYPVTRKGREYRQDKLQKA